MSAPVVVCAAVIERDGRVLLTRRLDGTHLEGLWEFPGGKCEAGESLQECLQREMREELGAEVAIGAEAFQVEHRYPTRTVRLHFFHCTLRTEPFPRLGQEMRWVLRSALPTLDFPEADRAFIGQLATGTP